MSDPTFWVGLGMTVFGIFGVAYFLGRQAHRNPLPTAPTRIVCREPAWPCYTLEFVAGPADGYLLRVADRPKSSVLLGGRYEAAEPSPSGKVKMVFVGFVGATERIGG